MDQQTEVKKLIKHKKEKKKQKNNQIAPIPPSIETLQQELSWSILRED